MVGVAGKYKGCETCRQRRVKCTMEKPFCQKCLNSGRECLGYERERVFITGTPESKGRVASHPKKGVPSRSQASAGESSQKPDMTPLPPLTSAWDDHTVVSHQGTEYSVLVLALQTKLSSLLRAPTEPEGPKGYHISLAPYTPSDLQPLLFEQDVQVAAQCIARLPSVDEGDDSAESYCVFFFEHASLLGSGEVGSEAMRRLGPASFSQFPSHHYFVRVYRPLAVGYALLSRRETFLSAPEWRSVPWHRHPKCSLDQLFDLLLFLPAIFARLDDLVLLEPTLNRRLRSHELLQNCLSLERQFDLWLHVATQPTPGHPFAYWVEEHPGPRSFIPFSNAYTFKDGITGLGFLYYWTAQVLFHRCIANLHRIILQPVVDSYPNMWPNVAPEPQIDVTRYQHGHDFATEICRGLDSVLDNTVQPDLLVTPMMTAMDLFKDFNTTSSNGLMETMWLDTFRTRLVEKGQHISDVLQRQKWIDVAEF
ncbi:hypothetical protein BGZ63DRAFT_374143 [Mariannaea sp. PMI_226]|nr:hypothetical protein BGZ63DRAFT_374143 [Mariannaea sp. PMI_226]